MQTRKLTYKLLSNSFLITYQVKSEAGKLTAINAYIRKEEISIINNLCFHLRKVEKEQIVSRRKEIIQNRTEINKLETR